MHNMKRRIAFLLAGIMIAGSLTAVPVVKTTTAAAAAKQEENVNLMPNGNFDTVSDNWGSYTTDGGKATVEQKNGALITDIKSVGKLEYSVQASCGSGFGLYKGGKYRLSFDVNSSIARQIKYCIQMNGGDYHAYVGEQISIDSTTKTVSVEFTMTEDTDLAPALCFNMGLYNEEDLEEHVVTIDNVDLELVDGSGIETSVKKQEENVNLMPGGTFDEEDSHWGSYTTDGGKADIGVKDGALTADIFSVGTLNYSVQASCGSGFALYQNGKYRLSFDISSTAARKLEYGIQMNGGDYHAYVSDRIAVDKDTQKVTIDFTMTEATDMAPALFFNMGIYDDKDLPEHTVSIDNVDLELVDGSGIVYEDEEKQEIPVNVNQLGYKPDDIKTAVFRGDAVGATFQVISTENDSVVYEGKISEGSYNEAAGEVDYIGDFSSVTEPGSYYIKADGLGQSYEFDIKEDVYQKVFTDAFDFFYLQRCGEDLDKDLAGGFSHEACHLEKAKIYGTDKYIDVSGGWHDAGDYGKYVVATSAAAADLLMAYDANKTAFSDKMNIPESGNKQSDLLDEIRGQLVWLQKMQDGESGGVYHKVTSANFPGYIGAVDDKAELIVSPISTTATGDFAAVMAMGYMEFKDSEPDFAEQCLVSAEKAYDYLMAQPASGFKNPEGIVTGEYGDQYDGDERYFAAAALYKATGDSRYHDDFKASVQENVKFGYGWADMGSYANVLYLSSDNQDKDTADAIKKATIKQADTLLKAAKEDGYGVSMGTDYYWGSNMSVMDNASKLMDAYNLTGNAEYLTYAKEHVNYVLGKNPMGICYVTANGDISPKNTHHRPSMVVGEAIPGALVGGPNKKLEDTFAKAYLSDAAPAKCYLDNAESYSTNEVDIYWNSALVRTMAQTGSVGEIQKYSNASIDASVDTTVNDNAISQVYTIASDGDDTIDVSKVTLRYYFSKDDNKDMKFWCDYAAANLQTDPWYQSLSDSVSGKIQKDGAGYYVEISIKDSVELTKDNGSVKIQTRIMNDDWGNFGTVKEGKLEVYYDGILVK